MLDSPSTEVQCETLWGLSNLTATPNLLHIEAFLQEHSLLSRVIGITSHSHSRLRGEALYTITNAICNADPNQLKRLFESNCTQLVQPLCSALTLGHEAGLNLNILHALRKLIDLDQHFPETFLGIDSVMTTVESMGGFEQMERLSETDKNQDVFNEALALVQRHQDH